MLGVGGIFENDKLVDNGRDAPVPHGRTCASIQPHQPPSPSPSDTPSPLNKLNFITSLKFNDKRKRNIKTKYSNTN